MEGHWAGLLHVGIPMGSCQTLQLQHIQNRSLSLKPPQQEPGNQLGPTMGLGMFLPMPGCPHGDMGTCTPHCPCGSSPPSCPTPEVTFWEHHPSSSTRDLPGAGAVLVPNLGPALAEK